MSRAALSARRSARTREWKPRDRPGSHEFYRQPSMNLLTTTFSRLAGAAVVCLSVTATTAHAAGDNPNLLWYDKPATKWVEALPIGNGRISAMVFGGVGEERLQLNEGTLWAGGPYDPVNP